MNERLYRSRDERIISGVAGGVAERFRVDPSLVRILWVILVPLTGGLAFLLYVIMAVVVPGEPAGDARWESWDRQSAGGYRWPDAGAAPAASAAAAPEASPPDASAAVAAAAIAAPSPTSPQSAPPGDSWQRTGDDPRSAGAAESQAAADARRDARREGWKGSGAVLVGLILIVVGGYFFARTYLPQIDVNQVWPVVLVGLGVVLLVRSIRGSDQPH